MKSKIRIAAWIGICSWACAVLLSACGGGGQDVDSLKSAERSVCDPGSGPAGTEVTCAVKDVDPDCTFFIVNQPNDNQPNDFVLHADEGTFSFTVPSLQPGIRDLYFQCGDSGIKPVGTFEVTLAEGSTGNSDVTPPPSGDEVIVPGATGGTGTGTTTGGETPPPSGDEVPDETPPATSTAPSIATFTMVPVTGSSARFRTFHVTFAVSNAKSAYLWGNVLNRTSDDAEASDPCKLQEARYLVTNELGTDLNEGSENFERWKYLSEGVLCEDSNCRETSSQSSLKASITQGPMAYKATASKVGSLFKDLAMADKAPNCRADLKQSDGTLAAGDDFYTRSHVRNGKLCLVVEGLDGQWKVQCLSGGELTAPAVELDSDSVTIEPSDKKIAFRLAFEAAYATKVSVDGCDKTAKTIDDFTGKASYEGECAVDSEKEKVTVTLSGMGDGNVKVKTYTLTMDKPKDDEVTLKLHGTAPLKNEEAKFDLKYSAERGYQIEDEEGKVFKGQASWFKKKGFEGFKNEERNKKSAIDSPADVQNQKIENITQDYEHTKWTFFVTDFNDKEYRDSYSVADFDDGFEIVSTTKETHYAFTYDSCGMTENPSTYDCCIPEHFGNGCRHDSDDGVWDCRDYRMSLTATWKAENMKSVSVKCWAFGESADTSTYNDTLNINGSKEDVWKAEINGERVTCDFTGKTLDGDETKVTKTWERGDGYCDGPDLNGESHNDSGFND